MNTLSPRILALGLALLLLPVASAQFDVGGDGPKVKTALYSRAAAGQLKVAVVLEVPPGHHLFHTVLHPPGKEAYGTPLQVKLDAKGVTWKPLVVPEPSIYKEEHTEAYVHYGTVVVYGLGTFAGDAPPAVKVTVKGQFCSEGEGAMCLDLEAFDVASAGAGADPLFAAFPAPAAFDPKPPAPPAPAAPDSGKAPAEPDPDAADGSLWNLIVVAFFGGLFALVMPCTYPMIPITISFFTKMAADRGGRVLPLSLTYGVGIVSIFILIGLIFGAGIIKFATHPVTNLAIALLFGVFALSLFGLYELRPPRFLLDLSGSASSRGGYVGVFLMGVTLVVTSFTCTVPFVGAVLSVSATGAGASTLNVVVGMGAFGLTMAVPFVILSLIPGFMSGMPKSGMWMNTIKVFLGFVELAAALKFLSNADLVWDWQLISRELFLLMWAGIFGCAAAYLLGWINLKGSADGGIGPGQMTFGVATMLFAIYCGYGAMGHRLDQIMIAIVPNYSGYEGGQTQGRRGGGATKTHTIVKDDFDTAIALARKENKRLLVNFTGYT